MREMIRFGFPMGLLAFAAMAVASAPSAANDTAVLDLKPTVIEDALPSAPAAAPTVSDSRSGPDPVVEDRKWDPDAGQTAKAIEPADKPIEADRTDGQAQTAQDPGPVPALADKASAPATVEDLDAGSRGVEKLAGAPPEATPPVTAPPVVAAPAPANSTTTAPTIAASGNAAPTTATSSAEAPAPIRTETVPAPAAPIAAGPATSPPVVVAQPVPAAPVPAAPTASVAASPESPITPATPATPSTPAPPVVAAAPAAPTKTVDTPAAKAPAAKSAAAAGQGPRPPMNRSRLEPIQSANPDRNIVVCVGGCGGKRVVLNEAKPTTPVRTPAGAEPTAAANSKVPVDKIARCAGGCYPFTSGFTHAGGYTQPEFGGARVVAVENANWLTNGPARTPPIARPARQITPPAPVKAKRDDWMARINRDREAERAARGQPGEPAL